MKLLFLLPLFIGAISAASINQNSLSPNEERITLGQIRRHVKRNAYVYTKTVKNGAPLVTLTCTVYNYFSSEQSDGKKGLCVASAVIAAGASLLKDIKPGDGVSDHLPLSGVVGVNVQKGTPLYNGGGFPGSTGLGSSHIELRDEQDTNTTNVNRTGNMWSNPFANIRRLGPDEGRSPFIKPHISPQTAASAVPPTHACGYGVAPIGTYTINGDQPLYLCDPSYKFGPAMTVTRSPYADKKKWNDWFTAFAFNDAYTNNAAYLILDHTNGLEQGNQNHGAITCFCGEADGQILILGVFGETSSTGYPSEHSCFSGTKNIDDSIGCEKALADNSQNIHDGGW